MNAFIKTAGGLKETVNNKLKTYTTAQEVYDAIESGELKEGENFATYVTEGIKEDIVSEVYAIESLIPGNASLTNLLATIADIQALDVGQLEARIDAIEADIPANTSSSNQLVNNSGLTQAYNALDTAIGNVSSTVSGIDARVTSNENNISSMSTTLANKVDQSDYDTAISSIDTALANKVDCSDFNTLSATVSGHTTAINSKADSSTVTSLASVVDGHTTSLANKVDCSDFNALSATVASHSTSLSNKASCADFSTLENTVSGHTSSIALINNDIDDLENKPGLDCTGTVKKVNGVSPDSNGNVSLSLVSCSDYNTGMASKADCADLPTFALSGDTLTITF